MPTFRVLATTRGRGHTGWSRAFPEARASPGRPPLSGTGWAEGPGGQGMEGTAKPQGPRGAGPSDQLRGPHRATFRPRIPRKARERPLPPAPGSTQGSEQARPPERGPSDPTHRCACTRACITWIALCLNPFPLGKCILKFKARIESRTHVVALPLPGRGPRVRSRPLGDSFPPGYARG